MTTHYNPFNPSRTKRRAGARWLIAVLLLAGGLARAQPAGALVGALDATPGAAPWVAMFQINGGGKCPGALVHPEWVLTAGHCVDDYDLQTGAVTIHNDPAIMSVRLGALKLSVHGPDEQVIPVSTIVRQPGFSVGKHAFGEICAAYCWQNDLVLLKLARPAVTSTTVRPIQLIRAPMSRVRAYKSSAGMDTLVVSSWGVTNSDPFAKRAFPMGGPWADSLLQVSLTVTGTTRNVNLPCADLGVYCAAGPSATPVRGICFGDSGSPAASRDAFGNWWLVGVSSYYKANQCGDTSYFVRVRNYLTWFDKYVPPIIPRTLLPIARAG